jgi:tRNA(Met) C34 N-acetyltransferase TmcA
LICTLRIHPSTFLLVDTVITSTELSFLVTPFDLKRLDSYANNVVDYHVILDLLPHVASLYFDKRLGDEVSLSAVQASILLGMGLQRKSIEEVEVRVLRTSPKGYQNHFLIADVQRSTNRKSCRCPSRKRWRCSTSLSERSARS